MDPVLAGKRHVTKRGPGPRWFVVLLYLISTLHCWWYPHICVHHHQSEDLALQETNLVTLTPHYGRLASWYETGAGGPAVIHDIINISSLILLCWWYLHIRVHHRQPGDLALQEVDGVTVVLTLGRLAPWNETGSGGGCLVLLITGPTQHYWRHIHLFAREIYP